MTKKTQSMELCKCKQFTGYTLGYICRSCKKPIYTKAMANKIDAKRENSQPVPTEESWSKEFDEKFSLIYNGKYTLKDFIRSQIALAKQSVAQEIYQEIEDSSFEVLFAKYLEHDDAVMAAEEIRKMVKSKYITEGKDK